MTWQRNTMFEIMEQVASSRVPGHGDLEEDVWIMVGRFTVAKPRVDASLLVFYQNDNVHTVHTSSSGFFFFGIVIVVEALGMYARLAWSEAQHPQANKGTGLRYQDMDLGGSLSVGLRVSFRRPFLERRVGLWGV